MVVSIYNTLCMFLKKFGRKEKHVLEVVTILMISFGRRCHHCLSFHACRDCLMKVKEKTENLETNK